LSVKLFHNFIVIQWLFCLLSNVRNVKIHYIRIIC